MNDNGTITPDEFDAIYRVLSDKLAHYDAALTQHMLAFAGDRKSKCYKPQAEYWKHCIAATKDILVYARSLIRVSHEGETIRPIRGDSEGWSDSDNSVEDTIGLDSWPDS